MERINYNNQNVYTQSTLNVGVNDLENAGKSTVPQSKISICEFSSDNVTDDFIKTEIEGDLVTLLKRTLNVP